MYHKSWRGATGATGSTRISKPPPSPPESSSAPATLPVLTPPTPISTKGSDKPLPLINSEERQDAKVKGSPIKSLRTPKPIILPSQREEAVKRPSLSAQLFSIGQAAARIATELHTKHQLLDNEDAGHTLLHTAPSNGFTVGRLSSKFPSPVLFYSDRCVYVFNHPFQAKQITMIMYYRDLQDVQLQRHKLRLQFKVPRVLVNYEGDYNPTAEDHVVAIDLSSSSDVEKIYSILNTRITMRVK